jgi:hypothetical protein
MRRRLLSGAPSPRSPADLARDIARPAGSVTIGYEAVTLNGQKVEAEGKNFDDFPSEQLSV